MPVRTTSALLHKLEVRQYRWRGFLETMLADSATHIPYCPGSQGFNAVEDQVIFLSKFDPENNLIEVWLEGKMTFHLDRGFKSPPA